jgi:hypothetical protein
VQVVPLVQVVSSSSSAINAFEAFESVLRFSLPSGSSGSNGACVIRGLSSTGVVAVRMAVPLLVAGAMTLIALAYLVSTTRAFRRAFPCSVRWHVCNRRAPVQKLWDKGSWEGANALAVVHSGDVDGGGAASQSHDRSSVEMTPNSRNPLYEVSPGRAAGAASSPVPPAAAGTESPTDTSAFQSLPDGSPTRGQPGGFSVSVPASARTDDHWSAKAAKKYDDAGRLTLRARAWGAALNLSLFAYSTWVSSSFRLLNCVAVPGEHGSKRFLFIDASKQCSMAHTGWQLPVYIVMALLIAFPVGLFFAVRRLHLHPSRRLQTSDTAQALHRVLYVTRVSTAQLLVHGRSPTTCRLAVFAVLSSQLRTIPRYVLLLGVCSNVPALGTPR